MFTVRGDEEGMQAGGSTAKPAETTLAGMCISCVHSKCAAASYGAYADEQLTLYFALSSRPLLKVEGRLVRIPALTVRVVIRDADTPPRLEVGPSEGDVPMLRATVYWGLTRENFDKLLASVQAPGRGVTAFLHAWPPAEIASADDPSSTSECLLNLTARTWGEADFLAAQRLLGDAVFEILGVAYFEPYTRAAQIARELGQSIGQAAKCHCELQALSDTAFHALRDFRVATRPLDTGATSHIDWSMSTNDFEQTYSSEANWAELKRGYDTLWRHFSVQGILQAGEKAAGPQTEGYAPRTDALEACAWLLRGNPLLRSPTLERQLADALVFVENLAFAQTLLWKQRAASFDSPFELGPSTASKPGKAFLAGLRALALELLLLGGTWFVADVIVNDAPLATWSLFLATTAVRWGFKKLDALRPAPQFQPVALLDDMARVYELFKHAAFHRGVARQELLRLTSRGAVYSPFVFELLERS